MFVVLQLPGSGERLQRAIQVALLTIAEAWAPELKRRPLPDLYSLPMRYRPEPKDSLAEEWVDPYTCYQRGYGDCDDLVIFRLSQIYAKTNFDFERRADLPAWPVVQWLRGTGQYHVLLRHRDGTLEDPAKYFLEKYG